MVSGTHILTDNNQYYHSANSVSNNALGGGRREAIWNYRETTQI